MIISCSKWARSRCVIVRHQAILHAHIRTISLQSIQHQRQDWIIMWRWRVLQTMRIAFAMSCLANSSLAFQASGARTVEFGTATVDHIVGMAMAPTERFAVVVTEAPNPEFPGLPRCRNQTVWTVDFRDKITVREVHTFSNGPKRLFEVQADVQVANDGTIFVRNYWDDSIWRSARGAALAVAEFGQNEVDAGLTRLESAAPAYFWNVTARPDGTAFYCRANSSSSHDPLPDAKNQLQLRALDGTILRWVDLPSGFYAFHVSQDGALLACQSDESIQFRDAGTLEVDLQRPAFDIPVGIRHDVFRPSHLCFSPDYSMVAIFSKFLISVFDTKSGRLLWQCRNDTLGDVWDFAFGPGDNSSVLAIGVLQSDPMKRGGRFNRYLIAGNRTGNSRDLWAGRGQNVVPCCLQQYGPSLMVSSNLDESTGAPVTGKPQLAILNASDLLDGGEQAGSRKP